MLKIVDGGELGKCDDTSCEICYPLEEDYCPYFMGNLHVHNEEKGKTITPKDNNRKSPR